MICVLLLSPGVGLPVVAGAGETNNENESIPEPVPYTPEEFHTPVLHLRRFEIIAFGIFPLALFFSHFGYETYRFGQKSMEAGEPDFRYAPGLFSPGSGAPLSPEERTDLLMFSIGFSVFFAAADYLLGVWERRAKR
jgi:hypothetical protein